MSALAQLNAIEKSQGSPADQQALLKNIMQTHGSATGFYRAAAKEMGTTPDHIMEKVEAMAQQPQQQPQTSGLAGANAQTTVPQTMTPPTQLNGTKMDASNRGLQQQGMATAQAVNTSAQNPQNTYAQGGSVPPPPDKDTANAMSANVKNIPSVITNAIKGSAAEKSWGTGKSTPTEHQYPEDKPYPPEKGDAMGKFLHDLENKGNYPAPPMSPPEDKYAKGGQVQESIKNMPLKDVIKLLASHPGLGGMGASDDGSSLHGSNLKEGGAIGGQNDPDVIRNPSKLPANMKREARSHGNGLLSMNKDVGTYNKGGNVQKMASGGLEGGSEEEDSTVGYGPDGTPIIQNADGTQQYGDVNQELGRPESASTLGTGEAPTNSTTSNVANMAPQSAAPPPSNQMAEGGEESPPPGSLKDEVADNIDAKLSPGEFVFSADATRYFGLRMLTALQDHARQQLAQMENQGNIRSPGDGKNPGEGQFAQDAQPNMNAYDKNGGNDKQQEPDNDDMVTGLLKECMGGANYASGGPVGNDFSTASTTSLSAMHDEGDDINKIVDDTKGGTKQDKEYMRDKAHDMNTKADAEYLNRSSEDKKSGNFGGYNQGGAVAQTGMATGGGLSEEQSLAKGGSVSDRRFETGRSNMVSSHPKGGSPLMDYARGGSVQKLDDGGYEAGNIDLHNRPVVHNADGTISTVKSMSFNEDGKEVLVPTISKEGKTLSNEQAIKLYHDTGEHLGKFNSSEEADKYAQQLHEDQAKEYQGKKKGGLIGYARGGIVSSTSSSLTPKKLASEIPTKVRSMQSLGTKLPSVKTVQPKIAKGGLLKNNVNNQRNINQSEASVGA